MKKLTTDQSKIDLVSRLVKEGHIDFAEALKLIEVENEEKIMYKENPFKFPYFPYTVKFWPGTGQ